MAPAQKDQDALLRQFREELVNEDLLHDGDSIGTDDHTLMQVFPTKFSLASSIVLTDLLLDDFCVRDNLT